MCVCVCVSDMRMRGEKVCVIKIISVEESKLVCVSERESVKEVKWEKE